MSNDSDMDYSSEDNECEYDYYNTGNVTIKVTVTPIILVIHLLSEDVFNQFPILTCQF